MHHRDLGIFAGNDAFQQKLHSGRVFKSLHEIPCQTRVIECVDLRNVQTRESGLVPDVTSESAFMAGGTIPNIDPAGASEGFIVGVFLMVNGKDKRWTACGLGSLKDGACNGPIIG